MTFDDQLKRAFDTLGDHLRDAAAELAVVAEADRQAAIGEAVDRARHEAGEQAREAMREDAKACELAASQRLVDAIRAIDRAHSLSDILDALVDCAGSEASRTGLLLVRGGRLHGRRFAGFEPSFDASEIDVALDDSGLIADAIRTGAATTAHAADRHAPPFAELPDDAEAVAVPLPMGGQVVAMLYAEQDSVSANVGWSDRIEVMGRHAARCLEALTAARAARIFPEPSEVSSAEADANLTSSIDHAGHASDEDEESARRYARLLISEIKLYHEPAVVNGQRERDLLTRLGGEIAHARALYEQHVPAHLRGGTDYFHDELIRTLANGDSSLLGELRAGKA